MGLTLNDFRVVMRTDLKDSGTLWSDAELDRCVELAVADLSRFMPLEKVHEHTINYTVSAEAMTSPATTSLSAVVAAQSIDVAAGSLLTISGQPDKPRPLTVTIVDADNSTYGLIISIRGMDENEVAQQENFNYSRGDSKTIVGKKLFKYVYEVELEQDYGSHALDTASVGYGLFTGVWTYLANKPIKPESETITSSPVGTTFTRDTDYEMDYINGRIKLKVGGSMAAATSYLVGYTKSRLGIDISAIIPELIRIQRVEYPVDRIPQQFVSFGIWGNFMYVGSQKTNSSQTELSDKEHIAIYYEMEHQPPNVFSPGSYPEFMDEVISIGGRAYALLMKALQQEHQAVTDMATLRTTLGYIGIGGASPTFIMSTIATALGKIDTYLAGTAGLDSKWSIGRITTTDAGELRTAITDALMNAHAYLTEVDTTDLSFTTPDSAETILAKYEDKIDTLNIGAQVSQIAAQFAQAYQGNANIRINGAIAYIQEAGLRLDNLRTYLEQAGAWGAIATGFLNEAMAELQQIDAYLTEASRYADVVNGDLVMADRFRAEGLERMNEFQATLKSKSEWRRKVAIVPVHQPA